MWTEIKEFIVDLFSALFSFLGDFFVWVFGKISSLFGYIFDLLPLPDFILNSSLSNYIPESVSWFLQVSSFPEALLIISSGITFRILRRFATFGVW